MATDMKITMLGASGAGKTCFMVGMYAVMREGVRGFTFTADPDLDLELSRRWEQLLEVEGADRWPAPNDNKPILYPFNFEYGFGKLAGFEWLDYRGGALDDRGTAADVQALKSHLKESSSVFLCVSGEHLIASAANRQSLVRGKARVSRMNQYLSELARERVDRPSVSIVITKYDRCAERDRKQVIAEIREMFNPLFAPESGWLVMICPVSLGMDLAEDLDGGSIDPTNIHLPVTFSVYSSFMRQVEQLRGSQRTKQEELAALNGGWWSRLVNQGQIQSRHDVIRQSESQLARIEQSMKLLTRDLMGKTQIYFGGREVTLDA